MLTKLLIIITALGVLYYNPTRSQDSTVPRCLFCGGTDDPLECSIAEANSGGCNSFPSQCLEFAGIKNNGTKDAIPWYYRGCVNNKTTCESLEGKTLYTVYCQLCDNNDYTVDNNCNNSTFPDPKTVLSFARKAVPTSGPGK